MKTVVVYEAEIPWARQAQAVLRDAAIQSELLDLPPTATLIETDRVARGVCCVNDWRPDAASGCSNEGER